jgi:hypothetical protein
VNFRDIATEQQKVLKKNAFDEAYDNLRRRFFGGFSKIAQEVAAESVFNEVMLTWRSGSDNHAEIVFKDTNYYVHITAFDHSFGFAEGGNFWTEASEEHYYISGHSDGKCVYRQVVAKPVLPLKIALSEELAKRYPRRALRRKSRIRAMGDYRFLWRGEEDEDRFRQFLLAVLSGGRPQSDFEMVFRKDKGGCFIASAVFGVEGREVSILRAFRDERLQHSKLGAMFIRIYILVSPSVASLLPRLPVLQKLTRTFLAMLVDQLSEAHNPGAALDVYRALRARRR